LLTFKIAFFPLMAKDGMPEMTEKIFKTFQKTWNCNYDEKGAIGRRYRRQDEAGTPFCVTVDVDSLKDQSVTVRERDSMQQQRINVTKLKEFFEEKL
jgi:glycyl-tRNA synthetase